MSSPKFTVPPEFQSTLRYVDAKDHRKALEHHVPVTSEKNIWAFWDKGVQAIPAWSKRNICNWVRLCGDSWTVRILNSIPESPNYMPKWIPKDMLPETYVEGTMTAEYVGTHSGDFLRGAALFLYGGVSMDVGIILIRDVSTFAGTA